MLFRSGEDGHTGFLESEAGVPAAHPEGYYNEDYVEFLIKKVWKLRIAKQSGGCAFYRKEVED